MGYLRAVIHTQYLPSFYLREDDFLTVTGLGIFTAFLLYFVFSILLYFKAPLFASKITEGFDDQQFESVDYQKLAAVLFSCAGVLIFFWAIESFIQSIGSINHYWIIDPQNPDRFWVEVKLLLSDGGIQMIIGVYIVAP